MICIVKSERLRGQHLTVLPGLTEMSPLGRLALRSLSAALASHILSLSAASRSG